MEFGAAFWDEGVEFVEEDDARDGGAGALEDLAEGAFGFADVLWGKWLLAEIRIQFLRSFIMYDTTVVSRLAVENVTYFVQ